MFLLDNIKSEYLGSLPLYAKKMFEELKPVLEKVNEDKIDTDKSKIIIEENNKSWILNITIISKDKRIPMLDLFASKNQCILGLAEHEEIECHTNPEKAANLIKEIISSTKKYLSGITILEHYDKNNKVFRKTFYYGVDTEGMKENRIGCSLYGFHFFTRSNRTEKITYSFI